MTVLKLTSKAQVTFKRELLRHLGVKPGDRIAVEMLPGGRAAISSIPKEDSLERFFGMFHDPTQPVLSIEEMNEIIADGWAGKR